MTTAQLFDQYVLGNYGRFPIAIERGEDGHVWDETGKQYLDFGTGIAVCSLGHSPAVMQEAIRQQAAELIHCSNLYQIRPQAELARFVVDTKHQLPGKVFFCNSGAEANDALIKLARKFAYDAHGASAGKNEIVTCTNSFHGRTLGGIAATGQEKVKVGFDPMLPGFLHVPFNDSATLREAVSEKTAAILFERGAWLRDSVVDFRLDRSGRATTARGLLDPALMARPMAAGRSLLRPRWRYWKSLRMSTHSTMS